MSKKLFTVVLMLGFAAVAFAATGAPVNAATPVEGGSVMWKQAPNAVTGWYWMYDNTEATPPFSTPLMPGLPSFSSITGSGSKLAPYNDRPFAYVLPDSFWYYGYWYVPGDELYISPDGWVSFDQTIEVNGAPTPPLTTPAIPNTDAPNELMAALWADYNPTIDPEPSATNRVYYYYEANGNILYIQWNAVKSGATPTNLYTFEASLQLGGNLLLDKMGSCGVMFSRHFIHFLYSSSANWTADNGKTGIENQGGTAGIQYGGTLANGRVIRAGYKKIFKHDVASVAFLAPGKMSLRWTETEPKVLVENVGTEAEHFAVTIDIYDEAETRVYHNVLGSYDLNPGDTATMIAPCWTPGEIGQTYEKFLIVSLANDECRANDTLMKTTFIHCDDSLGYDWNFGDASPGLGDAWYANIGYHQMTFYGVSGGLFTGGRHYMEAGFWLPDISPLKLELFKPTSGCGATNLTGLVGGAVMPATPVGGWNNIPFPGVGYYVQAGNPGNVFAAMVVSPDPSKGYPTQSAYTSYAMNVWPAAHPCYLGSGPGRGAYLYEPSSFYWSSYDPYGYGDYYTAATELFGHLVFGDFPLSPKPAPPCYYDEAHDICAYLWTKPSEDYVEDGVSITPEIAIANLGRTKEPETGFFPVKFFAVDMATSETTFTDQSLVSSIGWLGNNADNPDTLMVAINPWTPEGKCAKVIDGGPFVELELIGLVNLGVVGPDESDHCPYNDTIRRTVTVLLAHDVGVIDLVRTPDPSTPPDIYEIGTAVTMTATVENFGINQEHDVPVKLEIVDKTADPDTLVWQNIQLISVLDWRGNTLGNPYTADVTYPVFTVPTDNWLTATCKTELVGDLCPDDDIGPILNFHSGVAEDVVRLPYALESATPSGVTFTLPATANVSVKIYDISGKLVTTLVSGSQTAGRHEIRWNGTDNAGRTVAKGIYLVRMDSESFNATKKVVVY